MTLRVNRPRRNIPERGFHRARFVLGEVAVMRSHRCYRQVYAMERSAVAEEYR
jgi:hypothetical protein